MRKARIGFAVAVIAATLLAGCASAPDHAQRTVGTNTPATTATRVSSPAEQKLRAMLQAIDDGGDSLRAFASANERSQPGTTPEESRLFELLFLRQLSQGYALLEVTTATPTEAQARIRNRLTGDEESILVRVHADPPHRLRSYRIGVDTALVAAVAPPDNDPERIRNVQTYVRRLADNDNFSGVVLIAKEGQPIFQAAYGLRDRERRLPVEISTGFRLASLNKMFTAVAIARLVEQGKLRYEDSLATFLPDYPDDASAKKIQIKHLLTHTAGLGDAHDFLLNDAFWAEGGPAPDVKATLAFAGRAPLSSEPGTEWNYSNTGFALLGRILEIVTGRSYFDLLEESLFTPLGLGSTGFPELDAVGKDLALPYELHLSGDALAFRVAKFRTRRGGPAGDAASTAGDLLRFAEALRTGRIVSLDTLRTLSTGKPELQSPFYGYGFGLEFPRRDIYGHAGGAAGVCTQLAILRDMPVTYTVVVLSNTQGTCRQVTSKIVSNFAPKR